MPAPPATSFDLYLAPEGGKYDAEGLARAIREEAHVRVDPGDRTRLIYHCPDTGVFFSLILAPEVARVLARLSRPPEESLQAEEGDEESSDGGVEEGVGEDASGERSDEPSDDESRDESQDGFDSRFEAESGSEDGRASRGTGEHSGDEDDAEDQDGAEDEDEDEAEAEDQDEVPAFLHPVGISVPFGCPSFFVRRALDFSTRLARATGLSVHDPEGADGGDIARVLEDWAADHRRFLAVAKDAHRIVRWDTARSDAWWRYGSGRAALESELAADGVTVPRLHIVVHAGEVKTLAIWQVEEAVVLPRCDLLLVRKTRTKRGFFRTRQVVDEGIVKGDTMWDLLASFAEIRREPMELLIFREAKKPPGQVAAALEVLRMEPVANARRATLAGIIDIDPKLDP